MTYAIDTLTRLTMSGGQDSPTFGRNRLARGAALAVCAASSLGLAGCVADFDQGDLSAGNEPVQSLSETAELEETSYDFPMRKEDRPGGSFWRATNGHYDLSLWRFDEAANRWTPSIFPGNTTPDSNSDYLAYGQPVYAIEAGTVRTCWRNTPENNVAGRKLPGRLGCDGTENCGNPIDCGTSCSCTIPKVGNHLNIVGSDDTKILYAHFIPGTVPRELCPHEAVYVEDADDKSGPNGHNPDVYVEPSVAAQVRQGQFLGFIGNSGNSCSPHLHLARGTYPEDEGIRLRFNRGLHQPYPGDNPWDSSAWEPLTGDEPLVFGDTKPNPDVDAELVLPATGPASAHAYAWVLTSNASSTPPADYSRNTAGGVNAVTRSSPGVYVVRLPGLAADAYVWEISKGNVQVTAHGGENDATFCTVSSLNRSGSDVTVGVRCFSPSGTAVDSRFLIAYERRSVVHRQDRIGAYVTATLAGSSHVPPWDYQWNSSGSPNRVERLSTGRYRVTLPSLATSSARDIHVTAAGSTTARRCKVASTGNSGSDMTAEVRCFLNGAATDARFSMIVSRRPYSSLGGDSGSATDGFAFVNEPSNSAYQPDPAHQYYSGQQGFLTVTRQGTGRHRINIPAVTPASASAQVTAIGTGSEHCKLLSFGQGAEVRCYTNSGAPVDTRFQVTFISGPEL